MSSAPNYRCLLGAQAWDHAAWIGKFYPEDLPAEWRLSFYNTEFECVYLPHAQWCDQSDAVYRSWYQDTLPSFRFLLEPPPPDVNVPDAALALLMEKAVLIGPDAPGFISIPSDLNLKQFAHTLQTATSPLPFYLVSPTADLGQLQQVRTLLQVLGY